MSTVCHTLTFFFSFSRTLFFLSFFFFSFFFPRPGPLVKLLKGPAVGEPYERARPTAGASDGSRISACSSAAVSQLDTFTTQIAQDASALHRTAPLRTDPPAGSNREARTPQRAAPQGSKPTHLPLDTHTDTHTYTHTHGHGHADIHLCVHLHAVFIPTYTYMHMHTYTYIHITGAHIHRTRRTSVVPTGQAD